ncbi:hypothetical protein MTR_2g021810 [Medicago truncatula]|nr:hypothetical protein MTR_2g021810 [Medicago truncatula]
MEKMMVLTVTKRYGRVKHKRKKFHRKVRLVVADGRNDFEFQSEHRGNNSEGK